MPHLQSCYPAAEEANSGGRDGQVRVSLGGCILYTPTGVVNTESKLAYWLSSLLMGVMRPTLARWRVTLRAASPKQKRRPLNSMILGLLFP